MYDVRFLFIISTPSPSHTLLVLARLAREKASMLGECGTKGLDITPGY
jgi:hypothetical protein